METGSQRGGKRTVHSSTAYNRERNVSLYFPAPPPQERRKKATLSWQFHARKVEVSHVMLKKLFAPLFLCNKGRVSIQRLRGADGHNKKKLGGGGGGKKRKK